MERGLFLQAVMEWGCAASRCPRKSARSFPGASTSHDRHRRQCCRLRCGEAGSMRHLRLRKQLKLYPPPTCLNMLWAIHLQTNDSSATNGCQPNNLRSLYINLKMFLPSVATRVKKGCFLLSHFIETIREIRFEAITCGAGERQIVRFIRTASRLRKNMLYLKSEIKDLFRCMAVFATSLRPQRNKRILCIHGVI